MKREYKKPPVILGLDINDIRIDEAIRDAFYHFRWKLELLPASMGGYYHPKDETEVGGLLLHMKRVIWFVNKYCEEFEINDGTRDCMLAAAFFHDLSDCEIVKFKRKVRIIDAKVVQRETILDRKDEDFAYHPKKSAELAKFYLEKNNVPESYIKRIMGMVECHMSHWYSNMPKPNTLEEKIIALADFIMTRKELFPSEEEKH